MEYASRNLVSPTLSLDGKSSNIFFADVMETNDGFLDKALEGFTLFAFNQGEVSACPSRALIQESIYDGFIERAIARTTAIRMGHPLDPRTMIGALVSEGRLRQTLSYIDIAKEEGARLLAGGNRRVLEGELAGGFYVAPTIFAGTRAMRVFHEEIPGPVLTVTTFKTPEEALSLANDTMFGLGAGVWTRDATTAYRMARGIRAGRIWTNCYHLYPAHAAFGGYKQSGAGREMHKMALGEYQQTKSVLVSYSPKALGLFEDRRGGSGR
jgi:aldehyde dehydrogenase